eukprot:CAMPEP_0178373656 /NCGR_PEP_ID=MMETSP0689_2-20121128/1972_1 /TAXON_ID=160604 /ORGANISM="Amphidinium massartii, Strain CS-259" /LENGTH=347 /DNA_ID=CAMNT_0019993599 /DNA_START=193 /DNA_END=1233 /DNA_ORIENTATION=+
MMDAALLGVTLYLSSLNNFCMEGRLVPEVYLLGASKSASTSLATEMHAQGIGNPHNINYTSPGWPDKEFAFFDSYLNWTNSTLDFGRMKQAWLDCMPGCPASSTSRSIIADFTPMNLAYTALGPNLRPSSRVNIGGMMDFFSLPSALRHFYGSAMGRQITFIALLREPLARMQSAWYQSKAVQHPGLGILYNYTSSGGYVPDAHAGSSGASFAEDLLLAINEFSQGRTTMLMWSSIYGRQLQDWLRKFHAQQFTLIPYRYYTTIAPAEVCNGISQRLRMTITCNPSALSSHQSNVRPHPSLEEDVTLDLQQQFQELIAPENQLLREVLLDAHHRGSSLPALRPADAS